MSSLLPTEKTSLSKLMMHSEVIAQSAYNDSFTTLKNIRVSNILHKVMTGERIQKKDLDEQEYGLFA